MGCAAQSITNLCEPDRQIKGALVTVRYLFGIQTIYLDLVGLWRHFLCLEIVYHLFLLEQSMMAEWQLFCILCIVSNNQTPICGQMNASQLHCNIFAGKSVLLQACLGCYNNSCCYICQCSGSRLAKRATHITSLSDCQSFFASSLALSSPFTVFFCLPQPFQPCLSGAALFPHNKKNSAVSQHCEEWQLK